MIKPYLPRVLRSEQAEFLLEIVAACALGASILHWWLA